nr:MAG TPA: hypothetical protein [Caudoviricetes sp.]
MRFSIISPLLKLRKINFFRLAPTANRHIYILGNV